MKNRWLILSLLMVILTATLFSQEVILTNTDLELFIETFPLITNDLEALNMQMEQQANSLILPEAILLSTETQKIFTSRGWNDNYFLKMQIILQGAYLVFMETEMLAAAPEIQEALNELDATPVSEYFTLEMKQMMREQLMLAIQGINASTSMQMAAFDPANMELIRIYKLDLIRILELE